MVTKKKTVLEFSLAEIRKTVRKAPVPKTIKHTLQKEKRKKNKELSELNASLDP